MERLSTLDGTFLYAETPDTPMHTAGLVLFEPAAPGVNVFERFREHIKERAHLLPFFTRRLNAVPLPIDPVWIHEDNLDFDYHLRQVALPKPGTMEQLRDLVARLHMILLDRTKPLWQFYIIEGLENGGFALYNKTHHATADGGANMAAFEIILSDSPDPDPVSAQPAKSTAGREPTFLELVASAYTDFLDQQRRLAESWPEMAKAMASVGRRLAQDVRQPREIPQIIPKTPFNVSVSRHRSLATCTISLSETKAVGKANEAKVNDVVMTVCAGALRRYLLRRDQLPKEPLVAAVPVSLRKPGNVEMNNQVTAILCSLATDIEDPRERMLAIRASANDSKERLGDVRDALPTDISIFGAPVVMSGMAQLMGATKIADQLPPLVNVLISNVPGPRTTRYCAGAPATHVYPVSIASHGTALNMTVVSYLDNLDFGLIACREAVPDLQEVADGIVEEFSLLRQ